MYDEIDAVQVLHIPCAFYMPKLLRSDATAMGVFERKVQNQIQGLARADIDCLTWLNLFTDIVVVDFINIHQLCGFGHAFRTSFYEKICGHRRRDQPWLRWKKQRVKIIDERGMISVRVPGRKFPQAEILNKKVLKNKSLSLMNSSFYLLLLA